MGWWVMNQANAVDRKWGIDYVSEPSLLWVLEEDAKKLNLTVEMRVIMSNSEGRTRWIFKPEKRAS
jgi:hypothetical protein